jgi:hypothetical protein
LNSGVARISSKIGDAIAQCGHWVGELDHHDRRVRRALGGIARDVDRLDRLVVVTGLQVLADLLLVLALPDVLRDVLRGRQALLAGAVLLHADVERDRLAARREVLVHDLRELALLPDHERARVDAGELYDGGAFVRRRRVRVLLAAARAAPGERDEREEKEREPSAHGRGRLVGITSTDHPCA